MSAKLKRWVKVDFFDLPNVLPDIPRGPACYVIYCDGVVSYIGQSTNLKRRLNSYNLRYGYSEWFLTPWGQFRQFEVKWRRPSRYGEWAMTELRLIRRLRPQFNQVGVGRKRVAV